MSGIFPHRSMAGGHDIAMIIARLFHVEPIHALPKRGADIPLPLSRPAAGGGQATPSGLPANPFSTGAANV